MNLSRVKLLFIIAIILGIVVLLSLFMLSQREEEETLPEDGLSSVESELLFNPGTSEVEDPKLMIFDDLIIGESTDEEISQLGNLKEKKQISQGVEYHFASPLVDRDNLAVTENGVLVFKQFITLKDVDNWEAPSLISYKDKYGAVEYEKRGSVYYGNFETLYLWASKGVGVIANDFTDEVKEIHVFIPTTVENYLEKWGNDSSQFKEERIEDHSEEVAL